MTLLEPDAPGGLQGPPVPVLETERLILRAPRFEDAATIAALVNDRRIAETRCAFRIPIRSRTRKLFSPPPMPAAARSCS